MLRDRRIDPVARQAALGLAAVRIGVGVLMASGAGLRAAGFPRPGATGSALTKALGARDIALGAVTLAARDDRAALRAATLGAVVLDAADVLAFGVAAGDPETRRGGPAASPPLAPPSSPASGSGTGSADSVLAEPDRHPGHVV